MTSTPSDDLDAGDMARLVQGHDPALNELMARHGEKLFHYLVRQLHDEADAADLAQETFVRVYQNRSRFDSRQKFSTWLYTIATNLCRDRFRWRARHPQVSIDAPSGTSEATLRDCLPDAQPSPDEILAMAEEGEVVRRAIAALPEDLHTPLLLVEYEGRSQADIAQILNCTTKAVETRLYRARKELRATLGRLLENV